MRRRRAGVATAGVLAAGGLMAMLSGLLGLLDRPRRDFVAWRYVQVAQDKLSGRPIRRSSADHDLKRALALAGGNQLLLSRVGRLFVMCEDWQGGLDALSQTQLTSEGLRSAYAECLLKTGRRTQGANMLLLAAATARRDYNRGLLPPPLYAQRSNDAGYILADAGIYTQLGANLVASAVALEPLQPSYCDSLGWALHRLGRDRDAVFYLERAVRQMLPDPDPTVLYHLGVVYKRTKRLAEAQRMLLWCVRQDPENSAAQEELGKLHHVLPRPAWAGESGAGKSS